MAERRYGKMTRRATLAGAASGLLWLATRPRPGRAASVPTIGHDDPFEPFAFTEHGQSRGMLVEAVAAALARVGITPTFRPLPLAAVEAELAAGTVDALAFKGVTEQRRKVMDFSAPLMITGGAAFARPGLPAAANLAAYAGRTIVTPAQGPLAAEIARTHPQLKLITVESYDAALAAVLDSRADVAALNFQVGTRLINQKHRGLFTMPAEPYQRLPLAFAVAKGRNAELLAAFDSGLAAIVADGSLDVITRRWLSDGTDRQ